MDHEMDHLICIEDFEKVAVPKWDENAAGYYTSGADEEITLSENISAFRDIRILPRMMQKDVSHRDLSTTFMGCNVDFPIGVAPTAMHCMCHDEGECATAKAASSMNTVYIQSTLSTKSIEEIAEASPSGLKWFQLYIYKDRQVTESLVRRVEEAGYCALVLTVDAPLFGKRRKDARNKFKLPPQFSLANFVVNDEKSNRVNESEGGSGINEYVASLFDQSLTWKDLSWLKSITDLPIIVKGVLHPEDATIAASLGVKGVIVSNHGARQIDTSPATVRVLESVVEALKDKNVEVYLDGGIRTGNDVFKALALGAKGVFVGRPILYGLTLGGADGVARVLNILREELSLTMALCGVASIEDISRDYVVTPSQLKHKL